MVILANIYIVIKVDKFKIHDIPVNSKGGQNQNQTKYDRTVFLEEWSTLKSSTGHVVPFLHRKIRAAYGIIPFMGFERVFPRYKPVKAPAAVCTVPVTASWEPGYHKS
jgi:hypothetical protein